RRIVGKDVGGDLHQAELLKGEVAQPPHHGSHDPSAPIRLRQPVADFRSMRLANLEAVEPAAADQESVLVPDRPIHWLALLLRGLLDNRQPLVKIGFRVGIRYAEGVVVDFLFLEVLDASRLVGGPEFRKMKEYVNTARQSL